ncbi:MAG: DUF2278 family protein [Candidatus Xenobia bacterium]
MDLSSASNLPTWTSHRGQGQFGSVVGEFDHEVQLSGPRSQPHARFDLDVNGNPVEADINVHSALNPDGSPGGSDVLYAEKDTVVNSEPQDGIQTGGNFSYQDAGLKDSDFQPVSDDSLHQELIGLAQNSDKVQLNGMVYQDPGKTGIHDIHMNSGDVDPHYDYPDQDGYAAFYTNQGGQIHEHQVFIKFQSQSFDQSA